MQRRRWIGLALALVPVLVIAIFVGIPALMAIAYSLGLTGGPNSAVALLAQDQITAAHGITLQVYTNLFKDPSFRRDFWSTILVTVVSVAIVLAVGWGLALYLRFSDGWFPKLVSSLYLLPLFIPVVIASYAIVTFWSGTGYIAAILNHLGMAHFSGYSYSLTGIVIGEVWVNLPFAVLMLASGLQALPNEIIESARDVGATMPRILVRIMIPLNMVPTVIVGTFTGIGVLGSFTIPYLVGPTAPNLLGVTMTNYYQTYLEPQQSAAMAVIVFLIAAGLGVLYVRANVREDRKSGARS